MVRFVESDSTGLPLKRRQAAQACARCRRRKKRCWHNDHKNNKERHVSHGPESPINGATARIATDSPTVTESQPITTRSESRRTGGHMSRFVGDMNPEAIFMEATSLCSTRDVSVRGGLGVWEPGIPPRGKSTNAPALTSPSRQAVQEMMRAYVQSNCLACCPPPPDFAVLRRIYSEKLDPIFPILGGQSGIILSHTDTSGIVLQQVISLAAAGDPEATSHFRLGPDGVLLSRHDFCASLSSSIQIILDAGLITDRVLLTRLLAALSLYMQPSSPDEADTPAFLNSRAVHQMHTMGLQMASDESQATSQTTQTLFSCIWALDRLNSAFYGRATLIHERDIGWDLNNCIARQAPSFRLFLMIISLLDKVIDLYRPSNRNEKAAIIELPIFEQMILDADAARVPSSCLASLEIFYHSVAILSSQSPADGTSTDLPAPAINSRRSLAADRITSIVGQEFLGQLSYMSIIPYGVSLSLSVSYRKMRHSNVPMFRNRGKKAFQANASLLKSLDDTFWTVKTMVAMAEHVLQEMDKAVASLAQENGLADGSKKAELTSRGDHGPTDSNTGNAAPDAIIQGNAEWPVLETGPDVDIFGHFDPTFDLGAVDAALEGNLDIGASSNWFDWQQLWG